MIKELKISNFRIFDDEVTIKFRPITVLIGRNNAGKSSVIKFLLMLKQSIDSGSTEYLNPDGSFVNFGLFEQLKNSTTDKEYLTFFLEMYGDNRDSLALSSYLENYCQDLGPVNIDELTFVSSATIRYPNRHYTNDNSKAEFGVFFDNLPIEELNLMESIGNTNYLDYSEDVIKYLEQNIKYSSTSLDSILEIEDIHRIAAHFACMKKFKIGIQSLRHLYPVKSEFGNKVTGSPPKSRDVGQKGEYALQHLKNIYDEGGTTREIVEKYLDSVTSICNLKFSNSTSTIIETFATNKETEAESLVGQFGFGVSQCIPIFVQGAIMPENTSMMIEQPEAQIHPTAQLELGSYFAELWNKRRVGSIIETHSRNILLRLRRLIAAGELEPSDVSVVYFDIENHKPLIKNLEIDSDGDLERGLPAQFFGAGATENLQIALEKYDFDGESDE